MKGKNKQCLTERKEKKLNLGCGNDIREGWINVDYYSNHPDVLRLDLNKLPLPFSDNEFDYILLDNTLEHLSVNHREFMEEMHRILKSGGIIEIFLPFWSARCEHRTFFHPISYFDDICMSRSGSSNSCQCVKLFEVVVTEYTRKSIQLCFPFIKKNSHFILKKVDVNRQNRKRIN